MEDPQSIWIIAGGLTLFLAVITASLCAVTSVRLSALEKISQEQKNITAKKLFSLLQDDRSRILSGLSITKFVLSILIGTYLSYHIFLLRPQNIKTPILGILVLIFIIIFLTEILPRFLACINPEKASGFLYPIIVFIGFFAIPISKLAQKITSPLTSSINGSGDIISGLTADEIWHLIKEGYRKGILEKEEKEMIHSVFELTGTIAREVMVPRVDIEAVSSDAKLDEVIKLMIESGFSRIPLYSDTLDKILGIVYSKDVLPNIKDCSLDVLAIDVARKPPFFVPDTKPVVDLLREMQRRSISIAIVVDEYGGTSGLVTIEDLLEEIVGEITDEYDNEEPSIREESDGSYLVDASTIIENVNQFLEINVPAEEHETIGGFVYGYLGHIPEQGESMTLKKLGIDIIVKDVEGQRIQNLSIKKHKEANSKSLQEK